MPGWGEVTPQPGDDLVSKAPQRRIPREDDVIDIEGPYPPTAGREAGDLAVDVDVPEGGKSGELLLQLRRSGGDQRITRVENRELRLLRHRLPIAREVALAQTLYLDHAQVAGCHERVEQFAHLPQGEARPLPGLLH